MRKISKIAILGAGRMGKAMAIAFAYAGLKVALIDARQRSEIEFQDYHSQILSDLQQELQLLETIKFINAEQHI
ncbi:3-hydroxyacyl-CoA dehydrogenase NAD-binding domain-containing protein, partial [Acinetobacter bereziniae]